MDGKYFAVRIGNEIRIVEIETGEHKQTISLNSIGLVTKVTFSPDGKFIFLIIEPLGYVETERVSPSYIEKWSIEKGTCIQTWRLHDDRVKFFAISPNLVHCIVATYDKTAKILNLETQKCIRQLGGYIPTVRCAKYSPNKELCIVGSSDTTVKVWSVKMGKVIKVLSEHNESVEAVTFSVDGRYCVTGSIDGMSILWNVKTWTPIYVIECNEWIREICFSEDGLHYLVVSYQGWTWDKRALLIDRKNGCSVEFFDCEEFEYNLVSSDKQSVLYWNNDTNIWSIVKSNNKCDIDDAEVYMQFFSYGQNCLDSDCDNSSNTVIMENDSVFTSYDITDIHVARCSFKHIIANNKCQEILYQYGAIL